MKCWKASLGVLLFAVTSPVRADFTIDFSTNDPLWVPDRYDPADFSNVIFDGDSRLRMTISPDDSAANRPPAFSSAFYNTQGRSHVVDFTGSWSITAQTYVGADALAGANLRRTDVWASTGLTGSEVGADYFILGYYRFDPASPFDENSANIASGWRVWDDNIGWINLSLTLTGGWHEVNISYNENTLLASYAIDGQTVYTETPAGDYPFHLRNVSLQAYNFGQTNSYNVYWDNLQAQNSPVPEPAPWSMAALGFGIFCITQRRK